MKTNYRGEIEISIWLLIYLSRYAEKSHSISREYQTKRWILHITIHFFLECGNESIRIWVMYRYIVERKSYRIKFYMNLTTSISHIFEIARKKWKWITDLFIIMIKKFLRAYFSLCCCYCCFCCWLHDEIKRSDYKSVSNKNDINISTLRYVWKHLSAKYSDSTFCWQMHEKLLKNYRKKIASSWKNVYFEIVTTWEIERNVKI